MAGRAAALSASGIFAGAASSITAKWYEDPLNDLSTVTGTVGMQNTSFNILGSQAGTSNAFTAPDNDFDHFSFSQSGIALPSNSPYSLTLEFDLTLTGGASLDASPGLPLSARFGSRSGFLLKQMTRLASSGHAGGRSRRRRPAAIRSEPWATAQELRSQRIPRRGY